MIEEEDVNIPEPTKALSRGIKAIGKDTVHKICSGQNLLLGRTVLANHFANQIHQKYLQKSIPELVGQYPHSRRELVVFKHLAISEAWVVLSLAIAVKELIENSLDAGATLIEIKLKDQGLESVEVSDNGTGVKEANLEAMTAKYHTSKIREFSDLQMIETFGFRGEALSSLCALSEMTIVTRHSSSQVAIRIDLDHDGNIKKKTKCARHCGTTVTLSNLFSTLPVRKRDFANNIKREFMKMSQILNAYCLVSTGVRLICTNHTTKGVKMNIMSTNGSLNVIDNIQSIFGAKQVSSLMEMNQPGEVVKTDMDDLDISVSSNNTTSENYINIDLSHVKLEGWISSCAHGNGRGSKDRQYFYVNSRPCDPKNIIKVVNEVYHRYNAQQFPFVFLNVVLQPSNVDVNVTPDKRQLLLSNEKIILLGIKLSLLKTYGSIPATFKLQNTIVHTGNEHTNIIVNPINDTKPNPRKFMEILSQWKKTGETNVSSISFKRKLDEDNSYRNIKITKVEDGLTKGERLHHSGSINGNYFPDSEESFTDEKPSTYLSDVNIPHASREYSLVINPEGSENTEHRDGESLTHEKNSTYLSHVDMPLQSTEYSIVINPKDSEHTKHYDGDEFVKDTYKSSLTTPPKNHNDLKHITTCRTVPRSQNYINNLTLDNGNSHILESHVTLDYREEDPNQTNLLVGKDISTTIEEIEKLSSREEQLRNEYSHRNLKRLKFKTNISPAGNKSAEEELQKEISKDMFKQMEIIGQFNLGFIIVRLDKDLFIVDQHATDEKYNFEELQKNECLQKQTLTVPQTLEMTAINEMILLDNISVFEKNGFKFNVDENAPSTKKLKLIAKPFSKNWEFGKDDIDELIFMLQDAPDGSVCRPSRVRAMFASRACRKSVMIGQSLNQRAMERLILNMGLIDQPWNCPHGRPTMRHLVNLNMMEPNE